MMEFVLQYGLFVAKTVTIVVAAGVLVALLTGLSRRGRQPDRLQVTCLNDHYRSLKQAPGGEHSASQALQGRGKGPPQGAQGGEETQRPGG